MYLHVLDFENSVHHRLDISLYKIENIEDDIDEYIMDIISNKLDLSINNTQWMVSDKETIFHS